MHAMEAECDCLTTIARSAVKKTPKCTVTNDFITVKLSFENNSQYFNGENRNSINP